MDRSEELTEIVSRFLQVHDAWAKSPTDNLTEEYEDSVDAMLKAFAEGDIPERCRSLNGRVEYARSQWKSFQDYRSIIRPKPRDGWWSAVESLLKEVEALAVDEDRFIEPVKLLLEQKVGYNQIAHHIYGHEGVGPFLKNGVPQPKLIHQEAETPGSVIPADWVHPTEQSRRDARKAYLAQRLQHTQALVKAHADAKETLDELIEQGVSVTQIAQMKGLSLEAVATRMKELGVEAGTGAVLKSAAMATIHPAATAPEAGPLTDDDLDFGDDVDFEDDDDADDDEDDDDSSADSASDVTDAIDARILEMSAQGKGAAEIAKEMNCTTQKAAAVVRAHKGRQAAASPVPAPAAAPPASPATPQN